MTENIQSLLSEVQELRSEISSLKAALGSISQEDSSSGNELENAMMRVDEESLGEEEALAPFSVFYEEHEDIRSKGYYIFVPQGCVLVNGEEATFPDADDDSLVALPNLKDEGITTLYAHVNKSNEVSFSGEDWQDDDAFCFKVGVFEESYLRVCSSLVSLGGEGGAKAECTPHPFEVRRFKADFTSDNPDGLFVWIPDEYDLVVINDNVVHLEGLDPAWKSDGRWRSVNGLRFGKSLYLIISKTKDYFESEEETYHAKLATTAVGTDGYVQTIRIAAVENLAEDGEEPREQINQFVASAVFLYYGGEGDGGTTDVASETIVALGMDYVAKPSDEDYEDHPYAIRLKRGYLKNVNGELTVEEDRSLTQFIDTTPYTGEQPYVSDL